MALKKTPFLPLYVKEAWTDEEFILLPWDAQGLFWRLAGWQWLEGSIPADVKRVIDVVGKPQATRRLWPTMQRFFAPDPEQAGRLVNPRVEEVRASYFGEKEGRQKGAAITNAKRWGSDTLSDEETDRSSDSEATEKNDRSSDKNPDRFVRVARGAGAATALATAVGDSSRSPEGEREGEPPDPEGLAQAVLRLKPRFAQVGMRTEPSIALLAGWVERFGEELILETLADKDEKLRGKDFRYLETILVNRLDHPEERPKNRMKSEGNSKDFRGKSSGLDAEAERQLRAGENRFHPSQEEIRRDEVIEAARALKRRVQKAPDATASAYLSWLAPNGDGVVREDVLSFAEWQAQKVSA